MSIINQLDEHLTNMIAAGEVVERPSGIVKELIENSIDAKSTEITVNIKQGGIELIQIIDNGIGMDKTDALLAFERHATSKLSSIDDLWNINTMGFRGEAIPSIASVSKMVLTTNDGSESVQVSVEYGSDKRISASSLPKGTRIDVINLFQKTPARFKHLKSPNYESTLIIDIVQKFALGNPNISFTLISDDRQVFCSLGNGKIDQILMNIYSRDVAKGCIPLTLNDNDYNINGFAVLPCFARANKYHMYIFINKRMVRNYPLQKAILDAYSAYLPNDRFPICVINIDMDAKLVDVNVHPSKWEIRLSKEKQLDDLVKKAVVNALNNHMGVSQVEPSQTVHTIKPKSINKEKVIIQEFNFNNNVDTIVEPQESVMTSFTNDQEETIPERLTREFKEKTNVNNCHESDSKYNSVEELEVNKINDCMKSSEHLTDEIDKAVVNEGETEVENERDNVEETVVNPSFPNMVVLAQLSGRYILTQGDEGLYIIDQHAAQERYHYEYIQQKLENSKEDIQPLLVPITVNATSSACIHIDDINTKLSFANIKLEVFGENKLILREVPAWMINYDLTKFIQDLVDIYLKNYEVEIGTLRKHTIATLACHSSIRFNRNLSLEEMKQVVTDLRKCKQPFHCPHGRPTFILLTHKTLEKDFYRLG
ncbi:MAG: DNA mismatch repair endonuclease MutL [Erysipelotrichaceae bacterium]